MNEASNRKWIPLVVILTIGFGTIIVFLTLHFGFKVNILKSIIATAVFITTGLPFAYLFTRNM